MHAVEVECVPDFQRIFVVPNCTAVIAQAKIGIAKVVVTCPNSRMHRVGIEFEIDCQGLLIVFDGPSVLAKVTKYNPQVVEKRRIPCMSWRSRAAFSARSKYPIASRGLPTVCRICPEVVQSLLDALILPAFLILLQFTPEIVLGIPEGFEFPQVLLHPQLVAHPCLPALFEDLTFCQLRNLVVLEDFDRNLPLYQ